MDSKSTEIKAKTGSNLSANLKKKPCCTIQVTKHFPNVTQNPTTQFVQSAATSSQSMPKYVSISMCVTPQCVDFPSCWNKCQLLYSPLLLPLPSPLLPKTQDNVVQPPNWVSLKRFIGMLLNILTFF